MSRLPTMTFQSARSMYNGYIEIEKSKLDFFPQKIQTILTRMCFLGDLDQNVQYSNYLFFFYNNDNSVIILLVIIFCKTPGHTEGIKTNSSLSNDQA